MTTINVCIIFQLCNHNYDGGNNLDQDGGDYDYGGGNTTYDGGGKHDYNGGGNHCKCLHVYVFGASGDLNFFQLLVDIYSYWFLFPWKSFGLALSQLLFERFFFGATVRQRKDVLCTRLMGISKR